MTIEEEIIFVAMHQSSETLTTLTAGLDHSCDHGWFYGKRSIYSAVAYSTTPQVQK